MTSGFTPRSDWFPLAQGTRSQVGANKPLPFQREVYVLSLVLPSAHARSLNHRRVKSSSLLTSTDKVRPDPFRRRLTS